MTLSKEALKKNPELLEFVKIRNLLTHLFEYEEKAATLAPDWDKIKDYREQKMAPIMNTIMAKAEAILSRVPPKSAKGTALTYLVKQKPYLLKILEDGRYELTNLRDERLVKRFVLW